MVALCGNCHASVSKLGRDLQYEIKTSAINIKRGIFRGPLEYDKRDLVFKVGGNWYEDVPTIIQFRDIPIIACAISDNQTKISLNLLDKNGQTLLSVMENDVVFRVDDLWDFEYAHNLAIARCGPRDIALRMDFRGPEAIVEGKIWLGNLQVTLGPNETTLPGNNLMRGARMRKSSVGIRIG